jgi:hypothetical protein
MSMKELAITILGLAATYGMPWPGAAERQERKAAEAHAGVHLAVCAAPCAKGEPARARRPGE